MEGMCPAPAMISKRALGMRSAVARTRSGGVERSSCAGHDQSGQRDGGDLIGQIGIAQAGAGGDITFHRGAFEQIAPAGIIGGVIGFEAGGEPAIEHHGADRGDAAAADGGDAIVPALVGADLGGGVAEDQGGDAAGFADGGALGDEAADGDAGEPEAGEAGEIGKAQQVIDVIVEAIGAGGGIGEAVAALVIGEDAIGRRQGRNDVVPDAGVGAQGIGEDQRQAIGRAGQPVMQRDAIQRCKSHGSSPVCSLFKGGAGAL